MSSKLYRDPGFTLIEMMMVVMVLVILSTFAVIHYSKSSEDARLADAESTLLQIATAIKTNAYDTHTYFTGTVNDATSPGAAGGFPARPWALEEYEFSGADSATAPCVIASAHRKTSGPHGTSRSPYNTYGACVDINGNMAVANPMGVCTMLCSAGPATTTSAPTTTTMPPTTTAAPTTTSAPSTTTAPPTTTAAPTTTTTTAGPTTTAATTTTTLSCAPTGAACGVELSGSYPCPTITCNASPSSCNTACCSGGGAPATPSSNCTAQTCLCY